VDLLTFLQQLINGLSLGSLYALIAIGYTLVYGILRLITVAHGNLLMVAACVATMAVGLLSWPCPMAFGLGRLPGRAGLHPAHRHPAGAAHGAAGGGEIIKFLRGDSGAVGAVREPPLRELFEAVFPEDGVESVRASDRRRLPSPVIIFLIKFLIVRWTEVEAA